MPRLFLPFGEWMPDAQRFRNPGLLTCEGVCPVAGGYVGAPSPVALSATLAEQAYGLFVLPLAGSPAWEAYVGGWKHIYRVSAAGAITDLSGRVYALADLVSGSRFAQFGQNVIETRYAEVPQFLAPGAGSFVDLPLSTFKPRGRFPFVIRGNLFIAGCNLPAGYDGLSSGDNPQLVVWSQTDAPRYFGSPRADPQYVGSDYQQINNDFGRVVGAIGGQFGLIFQERAITRVDGPPYTFQEVVRGRSCRFPNSIVQIDQNTYFWGEAGPSVLEYGGQLLKEDSVTVLGDGKAVRTFLDNLTNFSGYGVNAAALALDISASVDLVNGLIFWAYPAGAGADNWVVAYNYREKRFSIFRSGSPGLATRSAIYHMTTRPESGTQWQVGGQSLFVARFFVGAGGDYVGTFQPGGYTAILEPGFVQLDQELATRVLRVRPIIVPASGAGGVTYTVRVEDLSSPGGNSVIAGGTATEAGWYTFPDSRFSDFHSFRLDVTANAHLVTQCAGLEVDFVTGGKASGV